MRRHPSVKALPLCPFTPHFLSVPSVQIAAACAGQALRRQFYGFVREWAATLSTLAGRQAGRQNADAAHRQQGSLGLAGRRLEPRWIGDGSRGHDLRQVMLQPSVCCPRCGPCLPKLLGHKGAGGCCRRLAGNNAKPRLAVVNRAVNSRSIYEKDLLAETLLVCEGALAKSYFRGFAFPARCSKTDGDTDL